MGYRCSFLDNEVYGADDVSAVFSRIMSEGVAVYPAEKTVARAIDDMTAQICSEGISPYGGAEVSYTDGVIRIGQGDIFFKSGVCVSIDSEGIELEYADAAGVYVTMVYEEEFNRVIPYADTVQPQGDAVPLAYIDGQGKVVDKRVYAKAKVGLNTSNVYHDFEIFIDKSKSTISADNYTVTHTLPNCDVKYLLLRSIVYGDTAANPSPDFFDISQDGEYEFNPTRDSSLGWKMKIRKQGATLGFYSYYVGGNGRNNITMEFTAV